MRPPFPTDSKAHPGQLAIQIPGMSGGSGQDRHAPPCALVEHSS
jgi:hypothetical protein